MAKCKYCRTDAGRESSGQCVRCGASDDSVTLAVPGTLEQNLARATVFARMMQAYIINPSLETEEADHG